MRTVSGSREGCAKRHSVTSSSFSLTTRHRCRNKSEGDWKGRLLMKFRDRDEVIEEGEFIVVPHGVEHCPIALEGACEVLLVDPVLSAAR